MKKRADLVAVSFIMLLTFELSSFRETAFKFYCGLTFFWSISRALFNPSKASIMSLGVVVILILLTTVNIIVHWAVYVQTVPNVIL